MAIRKIYYANDPRLRQKAKPIKKFGAGLKKLGDDMLETMIAGNGVGLAGPQIGLLVRLFVARIPEDEEDPQSGKEYVLVNPVLADVSKQEVLGIEGCLSIPRWYGRVWRPDWAVVKARTVHGKPVRMRMEGYLARVFLHEMDHLDGILFIDYIQNPDEDLWQEIPEEEEVQPA
jgi:peptide deformylase